MNVEFKYYVTDCSLICEFETSRSATTIWFWDSTLESNHYEALPRVWYWGLPCVMSSTEGSTWGGTILQALLFNYAFGAEKNPNHG